MAANKNARILLRETPVGVPGEEHFEYREAPLQEPGEGQVLVRNQWLSLDPYMRSQIAGRHLSGRVLPGEVMQGETVGQVVSSSSSEFKVGDPVRGMLGWQRFAVVDTTLLTRVSAEIDPPSYALSALGMPGLTAYAGLIWQAQPEPGETLVVAAATGAVGSVIVQLARRIGCRVIAVVGSDAKCDYAVNALGADVCINRRRENIAEQLDKICPEGVNIYFDLVGGDILETVSQRLSHGARVILCGMVADYNRPESGPSPGPSPAFWIRARARVHGLVVYDFEARRQEFIDACLPLVRRGELVMREDIADGLINAPWAFARLMRGENFGKTIVRID